MADEGLADHYQVLEELGRKFGQGYGILRTLTTLLGGSFGVVYKGIEKATGETVAIKHVSQPATEVTELRTILISLCFRLISSPTTTIFKIFRPKLLCSAHAPVHTLRNTKVAFCEGTSYGLSWSTLAADLAWIW